MNTEAPEFEFWTPTLYDVAHVLESAEDPEVRVDRVLALMRRFVPYDRVALLETTPVLQRAITVIPDAPDDERDALSTRLSALLSLISEGSLAEVRGVTLTHRPGRFHLAVPIIALGETTGIAFVERSATPYEDSHLAFLSVVAAQVGAYFAAVNAMRELRASEARFRGLYDSGMIGIAFMDTSGTIADANHTFAAIVKRSRADVRAGQVNWLAITAPEDVERGRAAIEEAVERGRCAPQEKRFVLEDGSVVPVLSGVARLESTEALVAFVLDISDQKRFETERANLLKERESDLEYLQMFMGMLGHDLRNPLGAISMSAEHLRRTEGDKVARTTSRILSSADRMVRLVDQLQDLTRIRLAGGMRVDRRHVNLRDICDRVIDELRASYPDASIHLDVTGDVTGQWDGDRLLQVVSNLVANAIQHGGGTRVVTLRVVGSETHVELTVHNPGVIPPDLLPVVFDPFRGVQARSLRKGLGLGLFIAKHIVDAHDGSIDVQSSEEQGTTFTFRLPRRPPKARHHRRGA